MAVWTWGRRQRLDIIYEILNASGKGCLKTQIVYKANINSKLAKKYVDFLLESGMLELERREDNAEVYKATGKAREFTRTYQYLMQGFQYSSTKRNDGVHYEKPVT